MIDIALFGPLSVRAGGTCLGPRDFGSAKAKQVLEILLLARGRAVTKDRLADLLWGESLPRRASATLENYVSVLRRHLGTLPGAAAGLIVTEPRAYRLDSSRYCLDLDLFDDLSRQATTDRVGTVGVQVRAALSLVTGDLVADEAYAPWVEDQRMAYRERHVDLLLLAAREALAERDLAAAINYARTATDVLPISETARYTTMLALYAQSRRSAALAAYERCKSMLAEEFGVAPAAETVALRAAIVRQDPPDELLPPATLVATDAPAA